MRKFNDEIAVPLSTAANGVVEFARGASLLTLQGKADLPDLLRASFKGPVPRVHVENGTVLFRYQHLSPREWATYALLWGRYAADVVLTTAVPWRMVIRGGASKCTASMSNVNLVGLEIHGGVSELTAYLPVPRGVVPIRIGGGASNVTLLRPPGVAVGVCVRGGASKLTFDHQFFGAAGGKLRLATPDDDEASNRYEIEVRGGASKLTVAVS